MCADSYGVTCGGGGTATPNSGGAFGLYLDSQVRVHPPIPAGLLKVSSSGRITLVVASPHAMPTLPAAVRDEP